MNESMPSDPKCPQLPYSIERRQVYLEIMQRNVVDRIHDSFSRGDETNVLKLISSILEIPKAFRNTPFYLSLLVYVLRLNIAFQSINSAYLLHILSFILSQNSSILGLTDNDGKCPLHIALEDTNHNFDLITFLVDACPSALTLVTSSGDTAIHIACKHHNLSHEIINFLVKSHPPALRYSANK
jgi:ankyrin repeat protein